MKRWPILLASCLVVLPGLGRISEAGIRGEGKYCGIPIFDRWDGCTLYSGICVMYISEKAKDALRPYAGQAIQIDATKVLQRINPGDGLISELSYLGPAPANRKWVALDGIRLLTSIKVGEDGKPVCSIVVENTGKEPVKVLRQELALTLLRKRGGSKQEMFGSIASDGPSFALITRQSFEIGGSDPRWNAKGVAAGKPYAWTIGKENALPHDFTLGPKERKQINVQFDLPDGQYDFLCGYGGGVHESKCLASNLSAFDVKDGKARLVEIEGR